MCRFALFLFNYIPLMSSPNDTNINLIFHCSRIPLYPAKFAIYFCSNLDFCTLVSQKNRIGRLRPWTSDRMLLVKHLKFVCQAKCLTVRPCQKACATFFACIKQKFCSTFSKTSRHNFCLIFLVKQYLIVLAAFSTLLVRNFFSYCQTSTIS